MSLRQELLKIDDSQVGPALGSVLERAAISPEEADSMAERLATDYPALAVAIITTQEFYEEGEMSRDEATLVVHGMALALCMLKEIGENQELRHLYE